MNHGYEDYEAIQKLCAIHNSLLPPDKEPRPLHWTFYRAGNATTNREQDRWAVRHYKKHRISGRSKKFNTIKRKVKSIRMRQSVTTTVSHFTR